MVKERKEKRILPEGYFLDRTCEKTLASAKTPLTSPQIINSKREIKKQTLNSHKTIKALTTLFRVANATQTNPTIAIRLFALFTDVWDMGRNFKRFSCLQFKSSIARRTFIHSAVMRAFQLFGLKTHV